MFPNDSYRCVNEDPQKKAEPTWICPSFLMEIIERLFHRCPKLFLESLRIQSKEFSVKSLNAVRHVYLVAVWNAHKTGPLIYDQADEAGGKEERNYNDDE